MSGVNVENYLQEHQIEYILHEHVAVYTTEEAAIHTSEIPGQDCKNLLVKDQKGKRFFLLVLPASLKADLKEFAKKVNEKKLSFANSKNLSDLLDLEPGSVSPFGLLNDHDKRVEVYIHKKVLDAQRVKFHPNRNTATIEMSGSMFSKYLELLERIINVIED